MIRYTLRALASQWRAWSGTVLVLAFAAALTDVCLVHRLSVTSPRVLAAARAAGVAPAELEISGLTVFVYSALVAIPVIAVVGQSCVHALRTTWAQWRLAGALPRQVFAGVVTTVAVLGLVACVPGILVGTAAAQPVSAVLTQMVAARMGPVEVTQTPLAVLLTVAAVVGVAVLGAIGPALAAVRVPAVEAVRDPVPTGRPRMGVARWAVAGLWTLVCAVQLIAGALVRPAPIPGDDLPGGGGQMMQAAMQLAVLAVLAAPVLVPGLLRAWSAPLARLGGPWLIARRSALWRSSLAASAVALLGLALSFTTALAGNVGTTRATVEAANLNHEVNPVDSMVLGAILAAMSLLGAVAVIAMSSRSRLREVAVLRCAGCTPGKLWAQAVIEAGLYVGTSALLSLVPMGVSALGEAWFLARAGLPFVPVAGAGPWAVVVLVSFLALVAALLAPVRRAYRSPVGLALAGE